MIKGHKPASLGRDLQLWWPFFRTKALSISLSSSLHGPLFTWLSSQHGTLFFPISPILISENLVEYWCLYTHMYVSSYTTRVMTYETTRGMPPICYFINISHLLNQIYPGKLLFRETHSTVLSCHYLCPSKSIYEIRVSISHTFFYYINRYFFF